jgi:hypothetical protein
MPREQITHNRIVEQTTPPDVDGIPSATISVEQPRRNLHVGWNRDGEWVQVAVEVTVAELRDMLAAAEAEAEAEARRLSEMGEYAVEAHQFKVWTDVLSRAEINQTVQVLRRARDAAYGKDA